MPGHRLLASVAAQKIRDFGYLLLFYNLNPGGPSHTVVVYGINYPNDDGAIIKLKVMDPMGAGGLKDVPLGDLQAKDALILGWSPLPTDRPAFP
jgi:hypothetical protein